jgi:hypothetical protein
MKREEVLYQMRRIANIKMEIELHLQLHEGEHTGLNEKGYAFYSKCCSYLGYLKCMLDELDRKRFERQRKVMYKRYLNAELDGLQDKAFKFSDERLK